MMTIRKIIPKTYFTIAFTLLALMLMSSKCEKNNQGPGEPELPPLTHEGKNTFGCKINGVNWVAETPSSIGGPTPLYGTYQNSSGELYLHAVKKNNEENVYEIIKIYVIGDIFSVSNHFITPIDIDNDEIVGFNELNNGNNCSGYYHDSLNPGSINITYFNTSLYIISGTFQMTLKNRECEDSLMKITDGRFDLKY